MGVACDCVFCGLASDCSCSMLSGTCGNPNLFLFELSTKISAALASPVPWKDPNKLILFLQAEGKVGQPVLAFQAWSPGSIAGSGLHGNEK